MFINRNESCLKLSLSYVDTNVDLSAGIIGQLTLGVNSTVTTTATAATKIQSSTSRERKTRRYRGLLQDQGQVGKPFLLFF